MLLRTLALISVCCTLAACSKKNPVYCEQASDCSGDLNFCDYDGDHGELGKTCVTDPQDESCNAAEKCSDGLACKNDPDDGLGGICVECLGDEDCPNSAPFCDVGDNTCQTPVCVQGSEGDNFCMTETPSTPVCGPNDRCAECNQSADCPSPSKPACDTETGECRACEAHDECVSGACNLENGSCIDETNIVYVDDGGADGPQCGTVTAPCLRFSGTDGALSKITGATRTIVVQPGAINDAFTIDNKVLTIIGQESAALTPQLTDGQAGMRLTNNSTVTVSNLRLAKSSETSTSMAVRCSASTLTLEDSLIDAVANGISSSSCNLTLLRSQVKDGSGKGIDVTQGSLTLLQSVVARNAGGGLQFEDADFEILNALIEENGANGSSGSSVGGMFLFGSGSHRLEFTTIVRNRVRDDNPNGSAIDCSGTTLDAQNNIISFAGASSINLVADCTITNSLVELPSGVYPGTGNINEPPLFVGTNDFHLMDGSPAVDVGVGNEVMIDLEGDPRPQGAGPDLGMDELRVSP